MLDCHPPFGGNDMNCPECKSKAKVDESRTRDNNTWRRRTCLSCGHKYQTVEKLFVKPVMRSKPKKVRDSLTKSRVGHYSTKRKKSFAPLQKEYESTVMRDPDVDTMTDEELEAWIFSEGANFDDED